MFWIVSLVVFWCLWKRISSLMYFQRIVCPWVSASSKLFQRGQLSNKRSGRESIEVLLDEDTNVAKILGWSVNSGIHWDLVEGFHMQVNSTEKTIKFSKHLKEGVASYTCSCLETF